MAWANSGLYASTLAATLSGTANAPNWSLATHKFALTGNGDTTLYDAALGSAIWSSHSAQEVSGTGWAAGGVVLSAFSGGSLAPTLTVSGTSPVLMVWGMTNLSETGTTLASAYGGYFISQVTTLYLIAGIWFGGSPYSTSAGTFAVTWSSGQVATINVASTH